MMHQHLVALARETPWFYQSLCAVRTLNLDKWCIGAGAVRNLVWDHLHGYDIPSALPDVDVAYFGFAVCTQACDGELQQQLDDMLTGTPWEVTNQAGVHLWFEDYFGHSVEPLESLEEAVSTWPEFCSAVGVTLLDDDSIGVIAPYGLHDLFDMVVQRNPKRVSPETYLKRVQQKRFVERWPMVRVEP